MENKYNMEPILDNLRKEESCWKSFIEKENLEVGILRLGPGEIDNQKPHQSDEIYFISQGNGFLTIDGEDFEIEKLSAYYVPKDTHHRFHSNTEEIIAFYVLN